MEINDDFDTLFEPFLKKDPAGEWELFLRRSRLEKIEVMLPGFRSMEENLQMNQTWDEERSL